MDSFNSNWYKVKNVTDTVWCISDNNNDLMYLVKGKEKAMLIDTGYGYGDLVQLCSELVDLPVISVITHAHPDHAMGAGQFPNNYIAEDDADLLRTVSSEDFRRSWMEFFLRNKNKGRFTFSEGFIEEWVMRDVKNITTVKDGDVFDLGGRKLRVLVTPGHTRGSICLLDETEELLFSGDTIVTCNHLLNLPESAPFRVFKEGLEHVKSFENSFKIIHSGHVDSINTEKLDELLEGAKGILSGTIKGEEFFSYVGPALKCSFGEGNYVICPLDVARQ